MRNGMEVGKMPRRTDESFTKLFCRRLRTVMAIKRMSSADIMRSSKLGASQISEYLNGHICPKADTMLELCRALDVSADYLLGLGNDPMIHSRRG